MFTRRSSALRDKHFSERPGLSLRPDCPTDVASNAVGKVPARHVDSLYAIAGDCGREWQHKPKPQPTRGQLGLAGPVMARSGQLCRSGRLALQFRLAFEVAERPEYGSGC
jgi:hypothetical protein